MARIVFIDDDEAVRSVMAATLVAGGHDTVLAASGREGLTAVRRERPDLVVCDVNMPDIDGHAVLEAIRADPNVSSTPFVFLTSLDAESDVDAGLLLGADAYVSKRLGRDGLLTTVNARLARRGPVLATEHNQTS